MKTVSISTSKENIETHLDGISESSEINVNRDIEKDNSILETQYLLSTKMNRKRLAESIDQMEMGKLEFYSFEQL
jgi:antitoxin YefM